MQKFEKSLKNLSNGDELRIILDQLSNSLIENLSILQNAIYVSIWAIHYRSLCKPSVERKSYLPSLGINFQRIYVSQIMTTVLQEQCTHWFCESIRKWRLEHVRAIFWHSCLLTVRVSSPSRIQKLCSNSEYMIRPIPKDGSITLGVISSTCFFSIPVLIDTISSVRRKSLPFTFNETCLK